MMKTNKLLFINLLLFSIAVNITAKGETNEQPQIITTKQERNYIREGNKLYKEKRFAEAEVQYRKALEEVPESETALFNLAASLIRQSGSTDANTGNTPVSQASQILQQLSKEGYIVDLSEKSFYNLGNLAFNQQDYASSIQMYKNALRKDPSDNKARQNLRIAQKKLNDQQNNQNQDNQQDKQDKQDKQNQQQQNQQNEDNKDQQQPQSPQDPQDKNQQKKDQQQTMSDANAEKILKAMENEEAATRKRVEAEKKKEASARKRAITNPW